MLYKNTITGRVVRQDEYNQMPLNDRYDYEDMDKEEEAKISKKMAKLDPKQIVRKPYYDKSFADIKRAGFCKSDKEIDRYILENRKGNADYDYILTREKEKKIYDEIMPEKALSPTPLDKEEVEVDGPMDEDIADTPKEPSYTIFNGQTGLSVTNSGYTWISGVDPIATDSNENIKIKETPILYPKSRAADNSSGTEPIAFAGYKTYSNNEQIGRLGIIVENKPKTFQEKFDQDLRNFEQRIIA